VENPREVVNQGDKVRVKILEIDSERRRLSLSLKRVEDQILPLREGAPPPDDAPAEGEELGDVPDLGLSEDVFSGSSEEAEEAPPLEDSAAAEEAPPDQEDRPA
jgi:small subunit ribosomal protein S1